MAEYCDLSRYPEDFEGIIPIYLPGEPAWGRIIAFHEPGGSWKGTWSSPRQGNGPDATPEDVFWLRDLLPRAFPYYGIYSVSYQPEIIHSPVAWYAGATDYIKAYLEDAPLEQRAPIVFIAFGFGGIYLEDAIRRIWDNTFRDQLGSTSSFRSWTPELDQLRGVVFLGTPQHLLQRSVEYRPLFPETLYHLLPDDQDLHFRSSQLDEIVQQFRRLVELRKLNIISVSEGTPPGRLQAAETQIGDLPPSREKVRQSTEPYKALPKCDSRESQHFKNLCRWIHAAFGDDFLKESAWRPTLIPTSRRRPYDLEYLSLYKQHDFTRERPPHHPPQVLPVDATFPADDSPSCWPAWVHIPANNEADFTRAMDMMHSARIFPRQISDALGTVLKAESNLPHSRCVRPNFDIHQHRAEKQFVNDTWYRVRVYEVRMFLPYIHWDTVNRFKTYNYHIWQHYAPDEEQPVPNGITFVLNPLLDHDFDHYHPRRTLDQSYYSRTRDTRRRDASQVVSRQTDVAHLPGGPRMIMVDQLWLCFWWAEAREKDRGDWTCISSAVLSAFPSTTYPSSIGDPPNLYRRMDVRQEVFQYFQDHPSLTLENRAPDVAALILGKALLGVMSQKDDWSVRFLERFRDAIAEVTDKHDEFFRALGDSMGDGSRRITIAQRRDELKLGLEIADILDELNMLKRLCETQSDVLRVIADTTGTREEELNWLKPLADEARRVRSVINRTYLYEIGVMWADAERVQKAILDVLDLQQREENIYEAHSANQQALFTARQALSAQDQADATDAQSGILFVFTVVTIVFLPLSFFPSYFGMWNIVGGEKNISRSYVTSVMWGTSGTFFGTLLFGAALWYHVSKKRAYRERVKDLAKLLREENLPQGLVDEQSRMYKEILAEKEAMVRAETRA